MAKTEIRVGVDTTKLAVAYGSADQAQAAGTTAYFGIEYGSYTLPANKKIISKTLMLRVNAPARTYGGQHYPNQSPTYYAGYTGYADNAPAGYTTVTTTSHPRDIEVAPTPIIPIDAPALYWFDMGKPYIKRTYPKPDSLSQGDWLPLELPDDHAMDPRGGYIYVREMRAYTPQENAADNRIPGKTAYKYTEPNVTTAVYYDFWARVGTDGDNIELSERNYLKIVVADYPQIPTVKSPILGETVSPSGGVARFSWAHNPSPQSNLPQKGYNLQISGDGLTWETITATSTNQYADVPIAKIPSGNFYWRVQTIDTDDAPSDYSDQAYAYYGTAPAAPSIVTSVFTSAKPRLIWTTTFTQSAYKVQILKGATYIVDITAESSDQFYDIPVALENGEQYTVRVSARDEAAHYSAWAEDTITANYIIPTTPSFFLSKKKDGIEIIISHNQTGILRYDIYRFAPGDTDFIRIGSTTTKKYKDWSVMDGEVRYKVIAVSDSGESKGAQQRTTFELTTGWLTPVDDPTHPFEVRYNVQDRYHTDYDVSMMEYAGREKPVAEFGQIAQRSISVSFATNDKDAYKALERVIRQRKTILYRNARMKMYGVCISPSDQPADYYGMIYNLSFIINEVEYSEVV